jgi:membrane protein YdbS with pleckstrin-like domain
MSKMKFRRFWFFALGGPVLIALPLSALFVAGRIVVFPRSPWFTALALIPLAWLGYRYLVWWTTVWILDPNKKEIVLQKGIIHQTEEQIPLSFAPRINSSQGLLGRLWDFGDVELAPFGKPVLFHQVANFRAFKAALTFQIQALPPKRPPILVQVIVACFAVFLKVSEMAITGAARLFRASRLSRARTWNGLLERIRPIALTITERIQGTRPIRRANINLFSTSYEGFLAFCEDYVLANGRQALPLDYTRPDNTRKYYPGGISPEAAETYLSILCQARIIVLRGNGHREWVIRRQIRNLHDIRRRISRQAFDETSNPYLTLNLVEQLTLPGMEREPNLDRALSMS